MFLHVSVCPQEGCPGPHPGVGVSRPTPGGWGSPGPHPGGRLKGLTVPGVSQHALRQTPTQADGYCFGRYASYWNAFLLHSEFGHEGDCIV